MTVSAISGQTAKILAPGTKTGFSALGQADFIKLMTAQMRMQDPFEPMDNKEMLAQMAQFSSLAGISDINDTLKQIATKLDAVMAAQASGAATARPTA